MNVLSKTRKHISTLLDDSEEKLWLGTLGEGLYIFDKKTETFSQFAFENEHNLARETYKNIFPNNNIKGTEYPEHSNRQDLYSLA